ncbi:MAG: nucleotidyltransferase family protein [Gammaproteobacteria bacterium]|nr:nucleotidyltransferase family protein [Gammaproteobacteria bacterium]
MFDPEALAWLVDSGLGPILWHVARQSPGHFGAEALQHLKTADLSARMLSAETFDTLEKILARAGEQHCPVTLLKGVSVTQQFYPQSHWRPMRDIDLLVESADRPRLEQILRELGFVQRGALSAEFFAGHHHSKPFHHGQWRCWVEVHTALFRPDTPPGRIAAFQPEVLHAERIRLPHAHASLWRLPDETQLVYTAVHWGAKLTVVGGLVPIVDTLLLLKNAGHTLDWERVLTICEDVTAARYMALMLAYLQRHDLYAVPDTVWNGLAHGRRSLGTLGMKILLATVDDYLAGGRGQNGFTSEAMLNTRWYTLLGEDSALRKLLQLPWRMLFPPAPTGRYAPVRHMRRLGSLLRGVRRRLQSSR